MAVLAAAAVIAGKVRHVAILALLAGDAKAHAGYRGPARIRYGGATVRTLAEGFTLRQAALGPTYAVLDGRLDLLVHRVLSCPASGHVALLKKGIVCRDLAPVANRFGRNGRFRNSIDQLIRESVTGAGLKAGPEDREKGYQRNSHRPVSAPNAAAAAIPSVYHVATKAAACSGQCRP